MGMALPLCPNFSETICSPCFTSQDDLQSLRYRVMLGAGVPEFYTPSNSLQSSFYLRRSPQAVKSDLTFALLLRA